MRPRFPIFLFLATLLVLGPGAWADTVTLKTGEKILGKIVGETAADYTIDYQVAAGIRDSRTVLKTEVDKIEKETPDEPAFQAIKSLKPGAASLPASNYEGVIRLLQSFVTQFPQSPHAAEVSQALSGLSAEKTRVDAGEVKIDGKWISKEEVQRERYQINGRATFSYMQELARRNDTIGALNTFDQLEKSYPGASAFPEAVGLAHQLIASLKLSAEQQLKTWQFTKKKRDTDTLILSEPARSQTLAAQKAEQQQYDAAFEASAKSGGKWPPFQRQHEKSLTALIAKAQTELTRVGGLPVDKMRQSLQLTEQARAELAQQNFEAAEGALRDANKLWAANEIAVRLTKEVAASKAAAVKAATPAPVATPTPVVRATPAAVKQAANVPVPVPVEPPKSFFATPLGLGVVAVGLVAAAAGYFSYKKKKEAAEQDLG